MTCSLGAHLILLQVFLENYQSASHGYNAAMRLVKLLEITDPMMHPIAKMPFTQAVIASLFSEARLDSAKLQRKITTFFPYFQNSSFL